MKLEALKAVLEALSGKCKEDMADKFSSPEEKMEEAVASAEGDSDPDQLDMGEDEELPVDELAQKTLDQDDEEEEKDPVKAGLKQFFKSKKPEASKPGTAIMIAVDKKPMKKGGMRG